MAKDSTVDPATVPSGADPAVKAALLVVQARDLKAAIEAKEVELEAVEKQLIQLGPGVHMADDGRWARVVAARSGSAGPVHYELASEDVPEARKLAGDEFKQLFDRKEVFTPCEGFGLVVPKLLTPAKRTGLLALCRRIGRPNGGAKAHVKYA